MVMNIEVVFKLGCFKIRIIGIVVKINILINVLNLLIFFCIVIIFVKNIIMSNLEILDG